MVKKPRYVLQHSLSVTVAMPLRRPACRWRNGLHIELQIDANGRIGKDDPAHINDVIVGCAINAILRLRRFGRGG